MCRHSRIYNSQWTRTWSLDWAVLSTGFHLILQRGDALALSRSNGGKFLAVGWPLTTTGKKTFCNALVYLLRMLQVRADFCLWAKSQVRHREWACSKVREWNRHLCSQVVLRLSVSMSAMLTRSTSFEGWSQGGSATQPQPVKCSTPHLA